MYYGVMLFFYKARNPSCFFFNLTWIKMNKNDLTSTGNSYYREITEHFSDENSISINVIAETLDTLFENIQIDKFVDLNKIIQINLIKSMID